MTIQIFKGVQNQELVLKADYDNALARGDSLAAKLEIIQGLMGVAQEANDIAKEGFIKLKADYDRLAAECAAHSKITLRIISMLSCSGYEAKDNSLNPAEALLFDAEAALDAPNISAYNAELKAQGVDEFGAFWQKNCDGESFIATEARKYAANLRAGVNP